MNVDRTNIFVAISMEICIEHVEKLGSYASVKFEPKLIQKEVLNLFDLYCKIRRI